MRSQSKTENEPQVTMSSLGGVAKVAVAGVVIPYLLGYFFSPSLIAEDHFHRFLSNPEKPEPPSKTPTTERRTTSHTVTNEACDEQLDSLLDKDLFESVKFVVHQNGVAEPCASFDASWEKFRAAIHTFDECPKLFDKYDVESLFTRFLDASLSEGACEPDDLDEPLEESILGFCDRGEEFTPLLSDHDKLVRIPEAETLPCHFHTREGLRISSFDGWNTLLKTAKNAPTCSGDQSEESCAEAVPEMHIYAVPAGRIFMIAPKYVGEVFEMNHVRGALGKPITLEVLSTSPRVFEVNNFFSRAESSDLVKRALNEKSESHRIKRSTTGAGSKHVNRQRTSESGFDTNGRTAMIVKKRCFDVLGMDEYIEGHSDGLQILRYNLTTAYIPHMDYIDDPQRRLRHNYDSAGQGGNRFGTILLYMSDLDEDAGGETVFTEAWPVGQPEEERVSLDQVCCTKNHSNCW